MPSEKCSQTRVSDSCRTCLDTADTTRGCAVSRWLDTGLTAVSACRAECRLTAVSECRGGLGRGSGSGVEVSTQGSTPYAKHTCAPRAASAPPPGCICRGGCIRAAPPPRRCARRSSPPPLCLQGFGRAHSTVYRRRASTPHAAHAAVSHCVGSSE